MLILARESRGHTQSELAEIAGVPQSRISKLEDGLIPAPPEDIMAKIAVSLNRPMHFFYQRGGRAACASFYRKKSSLPKRVLNTIDARMNIQRLHIEKLVKAVEFENKQIPHLDPDEIEGGPSQIAKQVRSFWGLPRGPVKDVIKIVEDLGCIVVFFNFETRKIDGLSVFTNDGTPVIFVNRDIPMDRMRFTIMHEVGHIIMHRVPTPNMEPEAHEFAAEFLMPASDITSTLYPLNIAQLARLKLYWKVAMAALLKRAETLGAISERYSRFLWMQMGKYGYRSMEPHGENLPKEQPSLLKEIIQTHLTDLEYSVGDLAFSLALNEEEFQQIYLPPSSKIQLMA